MYKIWFILNKIEVIIEALLTIRFLLSWLAPRMSNPLTDTIYSLTEPLLKPFRSILNFGNIYIDFSPLILILVIRILKSVLFKIMFII